MTTLKTIKEYTTAELKDWKAAYIRLNKTEGARFSLEQIDAELETRPPETARRVTRVRVARPANTTSPEGNRIYTLENHRMEPVRDPLIPVREYFALILKLSSQSRDGLVTYKEVWEGCGKGEWEGRNSMAAVAQSNIHLSYFCLGSNLPNVAALIVRQDTRAKVDSSLQYLKLGAEYKGHDVSNVTPLQYWEQEVAKSKQLAKVVNR